MFSTFENFLNSFELDEIESKTQASDKIMKTCVKNKPKAAAHKIMHLKRKFKHHIDDDSEAEEVERIRKGVFVNPFMDFAEEEKPVKEWVLKTPIKKINKNKIDSLVTKKQKRKIYSEERADELTEIIRGNLFPETEKFVAVKEFDLEEIKKNIDCILTETDASESQKLSPKKLMF